MGSQRKKDRGLAVLVEAARHHEIGVGATLVLRFPVESALFDLLQSGLQLTDLFLTVTSARFSSSQV